MHKSITYRLRLPGEDEIEQSLIYLLWASLQFPTEKSVYKVLGVLGKWSSYTKEGIHHDSYRRPKRNVTQRKQTASCFLLLRASQSTLQVSGLSKDRKLLQGEMRKLACFRVQCIQRRTGASSYVNNRGIQVIHATRIQAFFHQVHQVNFVFE